jgi:hypothetical protein
VVTYQSMLYKVALVSFELGWDYTGDILFESNVYTNPTDAMVEFSFCEPSHPNWFATMKMIKNSEVIEEQIFDASVIEID